MIAPNSFKENRGLQGKTCRNSCSITYILSSPETNANKHTFYNNNNRFNENSLSVPLKEAREKFEKEYLSLQLKKFNGNISKTATFVGMERSALHRKLKGLGIKEFN